MKSVHRLSGIALAGTIACVTAHAAPEPNYAADNIFGDWGGVRQTLHNRGIDVHANYLIEYAHNINGGRKSVDAYADQFHLESDFDLAKLFGLSGGSFHFAINQRNGTGLESKANINDLFEVQEIQGRGHVARLTQFYYRQKLWDDVVDFKIGRLVPGGAGADFMGFDCSFQNLIGCGSLPGYVSNGWYTWPIGQYGAVLTVNPSKNWYMRVGALDSNPRNLTGAQGLNPITPGGWKNTLAIGELGWHSSLGEEQLVGKWAIGGWHNSANYPDLFLSQNGQPLTTTGPDSQAMTRSSETGAYFLARQQVTKNTRGGGLTLFGNLVQSDENTDSTDQIVEVGLFYDAPFNGRERDRIGVLLARAHVSGQAANRIRFQNRDAATNAPVPEYEYTAEVNYNFRVSPGIFLLPNLQYVGHPGGVQGGGFFTFGLRATAEL